MLDLDNPFWRFSVGVYAARGVADECLALQDSLGIDVNILLLCAWLGSQGLVVHDAHLAKIEQRVGDWHTRVVRPLRALRRDIKSMPETAIGDVQLFRKKIAATELDAERIEQTWLFDAAQSLSQETSFVSATDSIRHNISAYLARAARGDRYIEPEALIGATSVYKESGD